MPTRIPNSESIEEFLKLLTQILGEAGPAEAQAAANTAAKKFRELAEQKEPYNYTNPGRPVSGWEKSSRRKYWLSQLAMLQGAAGQLFPGNLNWPTI